MKQLYIGLTLIFFLFAQAVHADIVVVTDSNKTPKFVLDTATGKTTPVNGVYVEGGENPVPPIPPIPDDPDDPQPPATEVQTKIGDAAKLVEDPSTAKALSLLYAEASEQIRLGEASLAAVRDTVDFSFDLMVKKAGGVVDNWKIIKAYIDAESVRIRQEGGLKTDAEWAVFFKSVSAGLNDATENAAIGDISKWLKIIACVFEGLERKE